MFGSRRLQIALLYLSQAIREVDEVLERCVLSKIRLPCIFSSRGAITEEPAFSKVASLRVFRRA